MINSQAQTKVVLFMLQLTFVWKCKISEFNFCSAAKNSIVTTIFPFNFTFSLVLRILIKYLYV